MFKGFKRKNVEIRISQDELYKVFKPGEQIVSVKITENLNEKIYQHQYYEGYKPVGIAGFTYGHYNVYVENGFALYVNTVPVEVNEVTVNDNEIKYTFGKPIEEVKKLMLK